ncbi:MULTISPECIES: hypothetical protein [Pseudomonas]|uniref:hypothetical protein n=1 Tax=Pseudomonas TaxID=286 RepID=UPI000F7F3501|nr:MULTISPECIES: hypothetical protein [Pseudomonas]MDH0301107.1 hypothetical protein [Pseudomonas sp. GD04091]MDH1983361.1 hypothetical protein [Pseudomonas sp. GD03689]QKG33227.1 hypothetical protein HPT07_00295 [Pseudomonas aeruginosa]RTA83627.1 hypothetical protein EJ611_00920 [Pseudomonas aeruginosa]RTB11644.1 hypothetical protein EJ609_12575 [Pseudomonas aeruginosa]
MYDRTRLFAKWGSPFLQRLVLVLLLAGVVQSAIGDFMSHGLAELASLTHHHHEIDVGELGQSSDEAESLAFDLSHPHHINDHSHEKLHSPVADLSTWVQHGLDRLIFALTLLVFLIAYRLERPPRMA